MKAGRMLINGMAAGFLLAALYGTQIEAKEWKLKEGVVLVDTDQKELNAYVLTEIDYSNEISQNPVFYHDNITLNLTVGPENLPEKKPLTNRTTGKLRLAYPLRTAYKVSDTRDSMTSCRLIGSMSGVNNASIFKNFSAGVNYYAAKEYKNVLKIEGLTDSSVFYDAYFAAYVMYGEENMPLVGQLLRAHYNKEYLVNYQVNYPWETDANQKSGSGSFAETLTYLSMPHVETDRERYRCVGWLVEKGEPWQGRTNEMVLPKAELITVGVATASTISLEDMRADVIVEETGNIQSKQEPEEIASDSNTSPRKEK